LGNRNGVTCFAQGQQAHGFVEGLQEYNEQLYHWYDSILDEGENDPLHKVAHKHDNSTNKSELAKVSYDPCNIPYRLKGLFAGG
jgi:hypothetical protein